MDGSNCGILTKIHVKKKGLVVVHPENKIVSTKSTPLELNSTFDDSFFFSFLYLPNIRETSYRERYNTTISLHGQHRY